MRVKIWTKPIDPSHSAVMLYMTVKARQLAEPIFSTPSCFPLP